MHEIEKHRLEALTDGVFAIVMTLLVLELRAPDLDRGASDAEIVLRLARMLPNLYSFALTFGLSATFWWLSESLLQLTTRVTRTLLVMNLTFLFLVSLLPFSAALLGRFTSSAAATQIYYGHQLILGSLLAWQWRHAQRQVETQGQVDKGHLTQRFWILPAACIAALLASLVRPDYSRYAFAAAALAGVVMFRER
jgi:uncharacterized membrane protein